MSESPINPPRDSRFQSEVRLFHRVLISYIDFHQAKRISDRLLELRIYPGETNQDRTLYEALNSAAIVAYCRPFSRNEASNTALADLPERFLKMFSQEEQNLHSTVIVDRNTVLAHSDAEVWGMEPTILRLGNGKEVLAPMHNPVHAPLTREAMTSLNGMCAKLMEEMYKERQRLEPIVWKALRIYEPTKEESNSINNSRCGEKGG